MAVLSDELIQFLRERGGGMLCTRDERNRPFPHECFIAEVAADHLIGLVPQHLSLGLEANAAGNGRAALVASRIPGDHRSVQLKGKVSILEGARFRQPEFAPTVGPMVDWLSKSMPEEVARAVMDGAARAAAFRVRLDVAEVFDQSPGPKAGRSIAGGGS